MPRVSFTPNLQRHVACPPAQVQGGTVAQALAAALADNPRALGYVLDESGGLRRHMLVFVDGAPIHDREGLSDALQGSSEVYVMQALSGG
ncbi:MAG: MoaD/ThiS family protein [Planctomycetota bacterium]|nr:MAG: MoaD/ThiS family protein [Planctomycetota bacterium]